MADSQGRVWTGVLRVGPHRGDHRVALRAAISVAVPLLVLWMLGRLDLSIYASFGAFAALYGRHDVFRDRIRMQASAGGVLLAAMLIGTVLSVASAPAAVSILVLAVIASAVTLLAYTMRWHPPGPLFPVFAVGACATIPATAASFGDVLLVGGASVIFGLAVTAIIGLFTRGTREAPPRSRQPVGPIAWEMAATVAVAIVGAGFAGFLLLDSHWYWAAVGAVAAVSGPQLNARVIRGIQRLVGTLLGILVAAGMLAVDLPPLAVIALVVLLQAAAELFVGRNYGIAMVFITPLALLMVHLAAPAPVDVLLQDRAIETVIGVAVGTAVAVASAALRRRQTKS
ncbi:MULTISPECIES: FUSC family protein [unclassified Microbacterium]|uniref:FUSC family protein n=1 Tax=unclassified Microbacterium TaxID=2609290 RepID=UPI001604BE36|nr:MULTISPECIES: FUSC family protein [unclassified Microbacterium]QNA93891.1 FUSC family protein [Microbacterium sp. Se63.02b]QYM64192.1 FUSC family protein [Microbacterium sp. Se5.02b]